MDNIAVCPDNAHLFLSRCNLLEVVTNLTALYLVCRHTFIVKMIYNHATTNLALHDAETSKDELSNYIEFAV